MRGQCVQLKAGYLKGPCQARPKWVNKNNQRRSSDNPGVQAEELERCRKTGRGEAEQRNLSLLVYLRLSLSCVKNRIHSWIHFMLMPFFRFLFLIVIIVCFSYVCFFMYLNTVKIRERKWTVGRSYKGIYAWIYKKYFCSFVVVFFVQVIKHFDMLNNLILCLLSVLVVSYEPFWDAFPPLALRCVFRVSYHMCCWSLSHLFCASLLVYFFLIALIDYNLVCRTLTQKLK